MTIRRAAVESTLGSRPGGTCAGAGDDASLKRRAGVGLSLWDNCGRLVEPAHSKLCRGNEGCRSLRRNQANAELTLPDFTRTIHAIMAKGNGKKSSNGSALDFEAQLWAVAGQAVPAPHLMMTECNGVRPGGFRLGLIFLK